MTATLPQRNPLDSVTYEDLYVRWEKANWRAMEIDFSEDAEQWQSMFSDFERQAALWNYAMFFWGEDAVADGLSPYVDAAPLEEQKYFLTTQQVDEARHAVFFNRFMHEVCGVGDGTPGGGLEAIRPQLSWGFQKVFGRLEKMCDELRRDPSVPQLAAGIALYHMIIEATLAQPGQHFITSYLTDRDMLPGFRAGMENVAADEQRHIGFGVKLLSDLRRMDPDVPHAVADLLREVIPWTVAVIAPPGWDLRYVECFGYTLPELGAEGVSSFETKMRMAGMPLEELPGPPVLPIPGDDPLERADRGLRLIRGGFLGEKTDTLDYDPRSVREFFESVAAALDVSAAPEPGTIQWEFTDFEPWHVQVANGSTHTAQGRAPDPKVTLRCKFEDWVDVVAKREDPLRMAARGRLRPTGDVRWLWGARHMFPR